MPVDDLSRRDFVGLVTLAAATLSAGRPAAGAPSHAELIPPAKALPPDWLASLTARGARTPLTGAELEYVGMPCGGLTCGQMYLGGDGRLWHWDVMNLTAGTGEGHYANPPKPSSPLDQGFALAVTVGGQTDIRGLDRDGFAEVRFVGEYPLATIEYADPACPVRVRLEAGSPFVPGDLAASSFPATLLTYTLTNTGPTAVEVELAGWLQNAVALRSGGDWGVSRVNRIAALLLRPQTLSRADARSLLRVQARTLAQRVDAASRRPGLTAETRAHLQDSADTLRQALAAPLARSGA